MFRYLFCCPHACLECRMSTGIQLWVQVLAHKPQLFVYWSSKHVGNLFQVVSDLDVGVGAQGAFLAAPSGHLECSNFNVLLFKLKFPYEVLDVFLNILVLPLAEFEVGVGRTKKQSMCLFFSGEMKATGYRLYLVLVTKLIYPFRLPQKGLSKLTYILFKFPFPMLSMFFWQSSGSGGTNYTFPACKMPIGRLAMTFLQLYRCLSVVTSTIGSEKSILITFQPSFKVGLHIENKELTTLESPPSGIKSSLVQLSSPWQSLKESSLISTPSTFPLYVFRASYIFLTCSDCLDTLLLKKSSATVSSDVSSFDVLKQLSISYSICECRSSAFRMCLFFMSPQFSQQQVVDPNFPGILPQLASSTNWDMRLLSFLGQWTKLAPSQTWTPSNSSEQIRPPILSLLSMSKCGICCYVRVLEAPIPDIPAPMTMTSQLSVSISQC